MEPIAFYPKKQRFLLFGIVMLIFGIFFLFFPFLDGEDEFFVFFIAPLLAFLGIFVGILMLRQSQSKNPLVLLTQEGIHFRHYPTFSPVFVPWEDVTFVRNENGLGGDVVVVSVKNPQEVFNGIRGFIQKNHARNAKRVYASPIAIQSGYLAVPHMVVFKEIYNQLESRKNTL